jgi:hypothetical protein
MEPTIPDRYSQNPMLVLVENYILDTLGKLEPEKAAKLGALVCRTFGGKQWRQTLREQFQLPGDTDETLRALWKQRQEEAEANQTDLDAEDFAREQADALFDGIGG